ncbi:Oxysterol-binding protein [Fasciola hepatica]|uniref:Oxysterol-binding protein n=1 Tax=Fasciola hepatica TaxID=6192 RepID=A0A4E0QYC0_FASHE|nr:Oxysterol-binding protein [Fasciola hepatica]
MIEELAKQLRQLETLVKQNNLHTSLQLSNITSTHASPGYSHLPILPGQAVRVSDNRSLQKEMHHVIAKLNACDPAAMRSEEPNHSSPAKSREDRSIQESVMRVTPKLEAGSGEVCHVPVGSHHPNAESSDEDFFDAEEANAEFSVYLPPTNESAGGTSDRTESEMVSSSHLTGRSDSASMMSTSLGDENNGIPSVNDVAYEYESDVYGSDDDEDDAENQMKVQKARKPLREARVIQPRMRRHDSRSATLVPSGDRSSDRKSDLNSELSQAQNETRNTDTSLVPTRLLSRPRRTTIPPRPNYSLNLWSIMKNCIGKELTKIPMPVNFSEPLSMLQRLTEDFEYSSCLDRAAQCQDTLEQMAHVAAFTVSAYATTAVRVNKPFNPLLGETYECDRTDDRGWRSLAEQVSHHPPKCALHCESNAWYCWFEFSMNTKFRGKYLQINPVGTCHLVFRNTGHHYTWQKIPLTVHNIIVGRLWIDNSGEMDIINHSTGEKCHLSYKAYSYFSSETPRRVTGAITDKSGAVRYVLNGTWDESMEYAPVVTTRQPRNGKPILETGPARIAWQRNPLPPDSERMHYFTLFALQLNEEEPGVCPTDCRLRPDQRLMEVGKWDEANREKVVLEEKQRHRRRQIAASLAAKTLGLPDAASGHSDVNPPRRGSVAQSDISALTPSVISSFLDQADSAHRPMWFERQFDQDTGEAIFAFNGKYWEKKVIQDWSMCPDIY